MDYFRCNQAQHNWWSFNFIWMAIIYETVFNKATNIIAEYFIVLQKKMMFLQKTSVSYSKPKYHT